MWVFNSTNVPCRKDQVTWSSFPVDGGIALYLGFAAKIELVQCTKYWTNKSNQKIS